MKRVLVGLMMAAAVIAAFLRLRVGNIDSGVLLQCVFSFFAVFAASLDVPGDRIVRLLRIATLMSFGAALLVSPYLRLSHFAPIVGGSLVLFFVWLAAERYGRKALLSLLLLAPVAVWSALDLRNVIEHKRILRLAPTDVDRIVLVSPDGATTRTLDGVALEPIVDRLTMMDAFDADRGSLRDAWRGEMVLRDGRRDVLVIGRHERGRMATWIVLGRLDYVLYEPYDTVIADIVKAH